MLVQEIKLVRVSEDDFHIPISSVFDVEISNLKPEPRACSIEADIVIYNSAKMTFVIKNRYGKEGVIWTYNLR